jgi:hypothetical protein
VAGVTPHYDTHSKLELMERDVRDLHSSTHGMLRAIDENVRKIFQMQVHRTSGRLPDGNS